MSTTGFSTLYLLGKLYPNIPWREPIKVTQGEHERYACRICIANFGLNGSDVSELPTDPDEVARHIEAEH